MAKKFKILKISKVVGSGSLAVGPSMSSKLRPMSSPR